MPRRPPWLQLPRGGSGGPSAGAGEDHEGASHAEGRTFPPKPTEGAEVETRGIGRRGTETRTLECSRIRGGGVEVALARIQPHPREKTGEKMGRKAEVAPETRKRGAEGT